MNILIEPSSCHGTLKAVPSKSMGHRAMICAALAEGISRIENLGTSRDMEATLSCIQALGAKTRFEGNDLIIEGCNPARLDHPVSLDAYESGSTLRFLIPVAALSDQTVTFKGQPSLLARPMGIYADLFLAQGLRFNQTPEAIILQGPISGGVFSFPGSISSQFVSGLLFAAPLMESASEIALIPPVESLSYINITLSALKAFGIEITRLSETGYAISPQAYRPCTFKVEGDYSQLAFFAVLAALQNPISFENLNPDSLQGDQVILDFVKAAGASVSWNDGLLTIAPGSRSAFTFDLADCPDLGPALCVLASYLPGTSKLVNAGRLRIKESDRIAAMEAELKKWGVDITTDADTITIIGKPSYSMDHTVVIDGHNDHRIVMAMSIFGLLAQTPSIIEGAQAITKSYPAFFEDVRSIGGKAVEK